MISTIAGMMLGATALAPAPADRFDLLCKGTTTVTSGKVSKIEYEDRLSIDLSARLFSDSSSPIP